MFEKCIRSGITLAVKRYAKANKKYIKEQYNPDMQAHIFSIWTQTTLTGGQWSKNYQKNGFTGEKVNYFTSENEDLEIDVAYLKELHKNHKELLFLAERMKIGKLEKLLSNIKDTKTYVVHIKIMDQTLKYGS